MSIPVVAWPGSFACASCGYLMHAEPLPRLAVKEVPISCAHRGCEQFGKRLILKAQMIECEEAP